MYSADLKKWHREGHPESSAIGGQTVPVCSICTLVDMLEEYRLTICAYGAHIDQTCDCKFAFTRIEMAAFGLNQTSEMTGCAEIRTVQWMLRDGTI